METDPRSHSSERDDEEVGGDKDMAHTILASFRKKADAMLQDVFQLTEAFEKKLSNGGKELDLARRERDETRRELSNTQEKLSNELREHDETRRELSITQEKLSNEIFFHDETRRDLSNARCCYLVNFRIAKDNEARVQELKRQLVAEREKHQARARASEQQLAVEPETHQDHSQESDLDLMDDPESYHGSEPETDLEIVDEPEDHRGCEQESEPQVADELKNHQANAVAAQEELSTLKAALQERSEAVLADLTQELEEALGQIDKKDQELEAANSKVARLTEDLEPQSARQEGPPTKKSKFPIDDTLSSEIPAEDFKLSVETADRFGQSRPALLEQMSAPTPK